MEINKEDKMFPLDTSLRAARMREQGRVTVTFRSPTGQHITITAKAKAPRDNGKGWTTVPLAQAKIVYFEVPNSDGWNDRIAKMTHRGGFVVDSTTFEARVFCARQLVRFLSGQSLPPSLEVFEEDRCGRCGRTLTDPVSIQRGIGPECYGKCTGSQHETKVKASADDAVADSPARRGLEFARTGKSARQLVIEDSGLTPELQLVASQEATYIGNCIGGRPSDSARNAVNHVKRNDPLASPTARAQRLDVCPSVVTAADAWLAARRQAKVDGDPNDNVGNAAAWLADELAGTTDATRMNATPAFSEWSYANDITR